MKFGHVDQLNDVVFSLPKVDLKTKEMLSSYKTKEIPLFYFGAPGWSDFKFKGLLYPPKTQQKNFLNEFISHLKQLMS